MSRTPSSGNEEAEAAFLSRAGVSDESEGGAMGADDADFGWDASATEESLGGLKSGPVGSTAHDDSDKRAGMFQDDSLRAGGMK